jgi:hypothetical protein
MHMESNIVLFLETQRKPLGEEAMALLLLLR